MVRMSAHSSSLASRYRLWIVTLALVVFVAWRFVAIPHLYMREDEQLSFQYTEGTLIDMLTYQATQDNQAPLWYAVFWGWGQLAGRTEFAGRILSILLSALTAAFTFQLARRWFNDWRVGVFSVVMLMLSAYAFIGMMEIRPYSMVMLMAVCSMLAFDIWLRRRSTKSALLYGVTLAGMLYTHYFLASLIAFQFAYALDTVRPRGLMLRQGVLAAAIGALLWLPQLPVMIGQLRMLRRLAEQAGQVYGVGVGVPHTNEPTSWDTLVRLLEQLTNGQIVVLVVAVLIGVVQLRRRHGFAVAFGWGVIFPLTMLVANLWIAVYAGRYVVHASIGMAILCAAAVFAARKRLVTIGLGIAFIMCLGVGFGPSLPVRVPYRDIFQSINAYAEPGDRIMYVRANETDNHVAWHIREYLSPEIVPIPADDEAQLASTRRFWLVTGDLFDEEVESRFARLEPEYPVRRVIGECDLAWCYVAQLMVAPPLEDPIVFGGEMPFYGAEVDWIDDRTIQVRAYWRTDTVLLLDYSIGLHLLDASGSLIAQSDSAIQHYGVETVQTSRMQVGQIYEDKRVFGTPYSLNDRELTLSILV